MINAAHKNALLVECEHVNSLLNRTTRQTGDLTPYPDLSLQFVNTGLFNVKMEVWVSGRSSREPGQVLLERVHRVIIATINFDLWGDML